MSPILDARGVTVELATPAGWIRPVNDVSFTLEAGEALGLVGESGSGKSMLALALMGLLPEGAKTRGEAWLTTSTEPASEPRPPIDLFALREEERRNTRGRNIAMIFQEPMTALNPVMPAGAQIAESIRAHRRNLSRQQVERGVIAALELAAVPQPELRARQYPHELSGGLRQRVMIAMALAGGSQLGRSHSDGSDHGASDGERPPAGQPREPRVLIADEPTTALDVTVQKQILELLERLRRELGLALLFITHDLAVVAQVAQRIAVMYTGRIVEEGPASEVLGHPRHPYTSGLLRASPRLVRHKLEPIPGAVPPPSALPPGCAFEPRCVLRREECSAALPKLREAGPKHRARCVLVEETQDPERTSS